MDDEFLRFQAEIGALDTVPAAPVQEYGHSYPQTAAGVDGTFLPSVQGPKESTWSASGFASVATVERSASLGTTYPVVNEYPAPVAPVMTYGSFAGLSAAPPPIAPVRPLPVALPSANVTASGMEKKKRDAKTVHRGAADSKWVDNSLNEWPDNDYRLFCGDLGNEVTEEVLAHAFGKYKSFAKAKVVRDKWSRKSKGFGFVSFLDPLDAAAALREMNGKYVGNRPVKLSRSTWQERDLKSVQQKEKARKKELKKLAAAAALPPMGPPSFE